MFSVSLTVYALKGQSLTKKIVGINKHSMSDRIWLELENSIPIEYESNSLMLRDLDEMKLDYVLLDELIAVTVYSKQIKENNFHVVRKVKREQSYGVLLKGFSSEQSGCMQTAASIYSKQWLKKSLSSIGPDSRISDMASYFNLTDELLYPKQNLILIISLVMLLLLTVSGVVWQFFCMNKNRRKSTEQAISPKSFLKKIKGK
jgi:hypothetical protein